MVTLTNQYNPDYAIPPGWILDERLEVLGISQAEFARRCGRSPKLMSEIIAGNAPIEPRTALQFEKVLGVDASIWLGLENDYRLFQERESEARLAEKLASWAKRFPTKELVKRGIIQKPSSDADAVSSILAFFGMASVESWNVRQERAQLAYRHSPSFKSDEFTLATWLRLGEIEGSQVECSDYREATFRQSLKQIRHFTALRSSDAFDEATRLCADAGVALTIVKPLPKTALSGASWWLTPRKAVIQLSGRHMSDDQVWFSLFHEAAHILLHSKKSVFVHERNGNNSDTEAQADKWAADFLAPPRIWSGFVAESDFTEAAVLGFSDELGIAPGIVVGRLQYERHVDWKTSLNGLKVRFKWSE